MTRPVDPYRAQRRHMVRQHLARRDIRDRRVLRAMLRVPRERFVPTSLMADAYEDHPLPIGEGQTISQPYAVAFMLQVLELKGDERVLEIGTGSGYGAAVLSYLAAEVHTVERIESLALVAAQRLAQLGRTNVHVHHADGTNGWPPDAPYQAIVVTAAAWELPAAYPQQLDDEGRIVIPIGQSGFEQRLTCYWKRHGQLIDRDYGPVAFVPLVSDAD